MAPDVLRRTPHDDGLLDRTGILCASTPVRQCTAADPEDEPPEAVPRVPRSSLAGAAAAVLMVIVAIGAVTDRDLRPHAPSPVVAGGDSGAVGPSTRPGVTGDTESPTAASEGTGADPADDTLPESAPADEPAPAGEPADPARPGHDTGATGPAGLGTPDPAGPRNEVAVAATPTDAIGIPERSTAPMSAPDGARTDAGAARFDRPDSVAGDRPEASVAEWFDEVAERYRRYRESTDHSGSADPGHFRDSRGARGPEEPCDSPGHHDSRHARDHRDSRGLRHSRDGDPGDPGGAHAVPDTHESSAVRGREDHHGHDGHGHRRTADLWDRWDRD